MHKKRQRKGDRERFIEKKKKKPKSNRYQTNKLQADYISQKNHVYFFIANDVIHLK